MNDPSQNAPLNSMQLALGMNQSGGYYQSVGGQGGYGAGMFPTQQWQTYTNQMPMVQGPTGVMMPQTPSAPYNPYAPMGLGAMAPQGPAPYLYGRATPMAPPAYAGYQGSTPFLGAPSAQFQNPFTAAQEQIVATQERNLRGQVAAQGVAVRAGADAIGGGIGGLIGRRFGMTGVGAAVGVAMTDYAVGDSFQNSYMNREGSRIMGMAGLGAGIEHASRGFMVGGDYGNVTGSGFSHAASVRSARLMEDMASSSTFQRQTQERFNLGDVTKIAQIGGREGMLDGARGPQQYVTKVRDLARSVSAFMEMAQEPDIQRAIETMGRMRSSGLNYGETLRAVSNGRAYARMAGTSFEQMAAIGGSAGSQMYGSMGMTQGLGMQVGMGNYGMARASQASGIHNPQMMALMGGAEGAANLNNLFSASFLQSPMLAPAMMNAQGGINPGMIRALMSGGINASGMAARGSSNLNAMARGMGTEGIGMAVALQPLLQDSIGRMVEAQGPFARRGMEDQQILAQMRQWNLHGSAGYTQVAQAYGMTGTQALSRAREMGSADYYDNQRTQIEARRRERRATELQDNAADAPTMADRIAMESDTFAYARDSWRSGRRRVRNAFEDITHGTPADTHGFESADARNRYQQFSLNTGNRIDALSHMGAGGGLGGIHRGWMDRFSADQQIHGLAGAGGWLNTAGSALTATFGDERERELSIRGIRTMGRFSQGLMTSTTQERVAALGNAGNLFGSEAGRLEYAQTVARLSNQQHTGAGGMLAGTAANVAMQAGMNRLSPGGIIGGLVVGTDTVSNGLQVAGAGVTGHDQYRNAYISQMQRTQGWSAERAGRMFDQRNSEISASAAGDAEMLMTPAAREMHRRVISAGQTVGGTRERRTDYEGIYGRVLGQGAGDVRTRTAFNSLTDRVQGVGREGSDHNKKSRGYITAILALHARMVQGGPEARMAERRIREIQAEASRTLSSEEYVAFQQQVGGMMESTEHDADAALVGSRMLSRNVSGADLASAVTASDPARQRERLQADFSRGAQSLERQGGIMGDLYGGVAGSSDAIGTLRRNASRLASRPGALDNLDPAQRRDILAAARGDNDAVARLTDPALRGGAAGRQAVGQWNGSMIGRLFEHDQHVFEGRDAYVARQTARGTKADRDAETSESSTDAAQRGAQEQGIGGAADQLANAARSIERASRSLESAAHSAGFNSMIGSTPEP